MDMENSALFTVGKLRGIRTAAMTRVGGPMEGIDEGFTPTDELLEKTKITMLKIGLNVCKKVMDEINYD